MKDRNRPSRSQSPRAVPDRTKGRDEKVYAPGEMIFKPGDPSECAFIILSGQVEIVKDYPDQPARLALLGEGEIFGEMGLVDERPRTLAARAVSESRLKALSIDDFVDMVMSRPQESLKYLKILFERLRSMNIRVAGESVSGPRAEGSKKATLTLLPLTDKARAAIPAEGLRLTVLPFRIGRASARAHDLDPMQVNDLILPDENPHFVSKNHLSLEVENGRPVVRDRGSYLGTVVNGVSIGGEHRGASAPLNKGDNELIVGPKHSPFRFRVRVD